MGHLLIPMELSLYKDVILANFNFSIMLFEHNNQPDALWHTEGVLKPK